MKGKISVESLILAGICLADMIVTAVFVSLGRASESNPLMAVCLNRGVCTFILVKLASFVPFIAVCEYYRRRNPTFVRFAVRLAILLYVITYVVLVTRENVC